MGYGERRGGSNDLYVFARVPTIFLFLQFRIPSSKFDKRNVIQFVKWENNYSLFHVIKFSMSSVPPVRTIDFGISIRVGYVHWLVCRPLCFSGGTQQ
jgi:hypothetical protein